MSSVWCVVCRTYTAPTRTKADHEATAAHRKRLREPERRVKHGTRVDREPLYVCAFCDHVGDPKDHDEHLSA